MGKKKRFNEDEVGKGLQYIRNLPLKAGKTQAEVAAIYAPSIQAAMKRGYSLEEIQEGLAKTVGVSIQMTKFKAAMEALANEGVSVDGASPDKKIAKKDVAQTASPTSDQTDKDKKAKADASKPDEPKEGGTSETKAETANPQSAATTNANGPVLHKERINLNCKKEEQEQAKNLGAMWDNDKKVYFVPPQTDLGPFEKFLPKPLSSYGTQS